MSDERPFPDWNKPATKGDVIMAAVWGRAVTTKLAAVVVALYRNDREKATAALNEYFDSQDELRKKIDEIGGVNG